MIFDKQEHKDALIALLNQATFPGHLLELALELKQTVAAGQVTPSIIPMADAVDMPRRKRNGKALS